MLRFPYWLVFFCLFVSTLVQAQRKRGKAAGSFDFPSLFAEPAQINKMQAGSMERWQATACGVYSNYPYLKEKGLLEMPDRSIFQQEMEQAIIPIWKERWTERAWWGYMIRYFHGKPYQPITQLVLHFEYDGQGQFTMTTYALKPEAMAGLTGKWWTEEPLKGIEEQRDFTEEICVISGQKTEDLAYEIRNEQPCEAGKALTFATYDFYSKIQVPYWDLAMGFYDAEGNLMFRDKEPIRFTRLSQKEISKRVEAFQSGQK